MSSREDSLLDESDREWIPVGNAVVRLYGGDDGVYDIDDHDGQEP